MMTRRKLLATSAGSVLAAGAVAGASGAQDADGPGYFLSAQTGDQEVPPVETEAEGGAFFALGEGGTTLHYALGVRNIEDVTMAHIHLAPVGEAGPVVAWLFPAPEVQVPQLVTGRVDATLADDVVTAADLVGPLEGESLSTLAEEMAAGNTYVNVHTEQYPDGEIRGQIVPLGDVVDSVAAWQGAATPEQEPSPA